MPIGGPLPAIRIGLVVLLLVGSFAAFAVAQPKMPAPAGKRLARAPTLYDRLGGITGIQRVVDGLVESAASDPRIKAFFTATTADAKRLMALEQHMTDWICEAAGGPCEYTGKSMKEAHEGMRIEGSHFDAFSEDLAKALDRAGVKEREKKELLALLEPLRGDIVER